MTEAILDAMIENDQSGVELLAFDAGSARTASLLTWDHRDPFDRMIAGIAMTHDLAIVSRDEMFDSLEGVARVWA
ncbi:MAG: type II toxin-antitoxin system VapC family toxin [Geminicoccaceae bacterium]